MPAGVEPHCLGGSTSPSLSWGLRAAQGCSPLHCSGSQGSCQFISKGVPDWDKVSVSTPGHSALSQTHPTALRSSRMQQQPSQACQPIQACTGPPQGPHETTTGLMRDGVQSTSRRITHLEYQEQRWTPPPSHLSCSPGNSCSGVMVSRLTSAPSGCAARPSCSRCSKDMR